MPGFQTTLRYPLCVCMCVCVCVCWVSLLLWNVHTHTPTSVTSQLNSVHTKKTPHRHRIFLSELFILSPDPSAALYYVCQSLVITAWRIIRLQIDEMERSWQACWKPEWDAPLALGWGGGGGMCGQLSTIKNVYWGSYTNIMEMGEGVYIARREFTMARVTSGATVFVTSPSWRFSMSRRIYIVFLAFKLMLNVSDVNL